MKLTHPLKVYLPDTRGVEIQRYGLSNTKLGPNVFTYSRLPGKDTGTCPGSTEECEAICYAKRIFGKVRDIYHENTLAEVPPIPEECQLLRLHVSGDFDSNTYIMMWIERLLERPDVTMWVYTRSWRVPHLLNALENLRALPNVQMFASMDKSTKEMPPKGWRRAWLDGDGRADMWYRKSEHNRTTVDYTPTYMCPEEMGKKKTCEECRYCFDGKADDVTFLVH